MSTSRQERFKKRNEMIRQSFDKMSREKPEWRIDAIISDIAQHSFLAKRTIEAIIRYEGIYSDN